MTKRIGELVLIACYTLAAITLISCAKRPQSENIAKSEGAKAPAAKKKNEVNCGALKALERIPYKKDVPGGTPLYYEIVNEPLPYLDCMIESLGDGTRIQFPGDGPVIQNFTVSALSYGLLVDSGTIRFGDCIPDGVLKEVDEVGASAYVDWIADGEHKYQLQKCIEKKTRGDKAKLSVP